MTLTGQKSQMWLVRLIKHVAILTCIIFGTFLTQAQGF